MSKIRWREDPWTDFILTQLLTIRETSQLNLAERALLTAAVRSEMIVNTSIHDLLRTKARETLSELRSARRQLPTTG